MDPVTDESLASEIKELEGKHSIQLTHVPLWQTYYGEAGILAALVFVLGGVAGGLLAEVGADAWRQMKCICRRYMGEATRHLRAIERGGAVQQRVVMEVFFIFTREGREVVYGSGVAADEGDFDVLDSSLDQVDSLVAKLMREPGSRTLVVMRDVKGGGGLIAAEGKPDLVRRARKAVRP